MVRCSFCFVLSDIAVPLDRCDSIPAFVPERERAGRQHGLCTRGTVRRGRHVVIAGGIKQGDHQVQDGDEDTSG
jgi:hypothetical protein